MTAAPSWSQYLHSFHTAHAGITEDVLSAATVGGITPYQWLAEPLRDVTTLIVDAASGSGTMHQAVPAKDWVGLEMSDGELHRAALAGHAPLVRADVTTLPLRAHSAGAVVCSMGLMLIEPLDAFLDEVARVLVPGGVFAATIPVEAPLRGSDRLRYLRLLLALRVRRLDYPNRSTLADPRDQLAKHGLSIVSDERLRFEYVVSDAAAAETLVRSLYMPDASEGRIEAGIRVARRWRGDAIGIPIRRIVCRLASPV